MKSLSRCEKILSLLLRGTSALGLVHSGLGAGTLSSFMRQRLGSQWARSPAPLLAETPLCSLHMTFVLPSVPHPTPMFCVLSRASVGGQAFSDSKQGPGGPPERPGGGATGGRACTMCSTFALPPLNGHACLPVLVVPALSPCSCPHCVTGTCRHPRVVSTPAAKPAQSCEQPSRSSSERLDAAPARGPGPKQVRVTLWRESPHQTPEGQQSGSYSH